MRKLTRTEANFEETREQNRFRYPRRDGRITFRRERSFTHAPAVDHAIAQSASLI